MVNLAIIPARGGSKRIPRKNIKPFLGKPIITYSITAAIESNLFDEVIVSTDDEEIASIAIEYGAKVPFLRSKENSSDYATTFDVIEEVINWYKLKDVEIVNTCCLYATAPFISSSLLKESFNLLENSKFDCVFPAVRFGFPIQRAVKLDSTSNKMEMFQPEHLNSRSQDLEPAFHDVGQFYFFNVETIIKERKLWTNNTGIVEISELEAQDIDNEIDWKLAEIKYKMRLDNEKNSL